MSNKSKQDHSIQEKPQNIGTIDRVFRILLGLLLLSTMFIASRTTETFLGFTSEEFPYTWVALLAIYPMLTAILGWDPILQSRGVRSETHLKGDVSGTVKDQVEAVADASKRQWREARQH